MRQAPICDDRAVFSASVAPPWSIGDQQNRRDATDAEKSPLPIFLLYIFLFIAGNEQRLRTLRAPICG